mmetsp:Transcript_117221/g.269212  ORF Transcript_117221/g.269212 Transcript_117221/m.269212 type:complete len:269 (+) Transcript_117221:462-1268(+)
MRRSKTSRSLSMICTRTSLTACRHWRSRAATCFPRGRRWRCWWQLCTRSLRPTRPEWSHFMATWAPCIPTLVGLTAGSAALPPRAGSVMRLQNCRIKWRSLKPRWPVTTCSPPAPDTWSRGVQMLRPRATATSTPASWRSRLRPLRSVQLTGRTLWKSWSCRSSSLQSDQWPARLRSRATATSTPASWRSRWPPSRSVQLTGRTLWRSWSCVSSSWQSGRVRRRLLRQPPWAHLPTPVRRWPPWLSMCLSWIRHLLSASAACRTSSHG